MKKIGLLDVFDIDPIEWKLVLNLCGGVGEKRFIDEWNEGKLNLENVGFSYWSHQSEKGTGRKNFNVGDKVLGFMRIDGDRYLFITAGLITHVPETAGACEYRKLHEFDGYIGRLIISTKKGNTFFRYVFRLDNYLEKREIEVAEILRAELRPIEFTGFDNVHLSFPVLMQVLESEKFSDYRRNLASVKGVYCLTDRYNGKLYIGSAYGENGVAQRWKVYLDTRTGGNVKLRDLYRRKGKTYFEKNFTFTLLEFFDKKTSDRKVLARENYWKDALDSRSHGYNDN